MVTNINPENKIMKRSSRLQPLSREHHKALVLSKKIEIADCSRLDELADLVQEFFVAELEPHFLTEELELLPRLVKFGAKVFVQQTLDEHQTLRSLIIEIRNGEIEALKKFGILLADHVRFEERMLFPLAEQLVDAQWLSGAERVGKGV